MAEGSSSLEQEAACLIAIRDHRERGRDQDSKLSLRVPPSSALLSSFLSVHRVRNSSVGRDEASPLMIWSPLKPHLWIQLRRRSSFHYTRLGRNSQASHNRMPQSGWLTQQKPAFHGLVQCQVASVGSCWGLFSWLFILFAHGRQTDDRDRWWCR